MAFRSLVVLLASVPLLAAASAPGHSTSYKLGWHVGRVIGTYGIYIAAAALLVVVGWLWIRRTRARSSQP